MSLPDPRRIRGTRSATWAGTLHRLRTVHLPFLSVLGVVAAGVVLVLADHWRRGALLLGVALLLGALLRAVLPEARAGLLVVRNRPSDVLTFGALGAAVLVLAGSISALGTR